MKKFYILQLFTVIMLLSFQANAQRYVLIPASTDPAVPTNILSYIKGDTTATGERTDNNTIYQLENGKVYITKGKLVNTPDWTLDIEAQDLTNTDSKPILTRIPNSSGKYPSVIGAGGDLTLKNLWIISGEKGPLANHDWGKIRVMGENSRVIVDHCIIEKDRGGFIQVRANGIKAYITNSILRNGGNRRIIQGNGRGIDCRNYSMDTLVLKNTIVHNIVDRFIRSQGATAPHNYIEVDHCTSFNVAGRHGFIQLGRVNTAKITNNIFMDPIMLGTSPVYTDEQTQPDSAKHAVISLDTLYDATSLTISNNNIFWSTDVTDYWATNDSVSMPNVLSALVVENLGSAADDAYFSEPLTLSSVPGSILQYVKDLYANPASEEMYDIIVEDISRQGTDYDSGNLFDFSTFDPCYSTSSNSATGSTTGGAIGATFMCPDLTSDLPNIFIEDHRMSIYPNPVSNEFSIKLMTSINSDIHVSIIDMNGRIVFKNTHFGVSAGNHQYSYNLPNSIKGIYILKVQTKEGIMTRKMIVQ